MTMINENTINKIVGLNLKSRFFGSPVKDRIESIYSNNPFNVESLVVALIYLERISKNEKIDNTNIIPIIQQCIILANKFIIDYEIVNNDYEEEMKVIDMLNWRLFVNENDYSRMKIKFSNLVPCI